MTRSLCLLGLLLLSLTARAVETLDWIPWTDDLFQRAQKEKRFVILDLQAVWCHWCHVMEEKTYSDPKVIALLKKSYLTVRVDQDSRPDLSNRYEDYGWPATIIFASDGQELVKRAGYIAPEPMVSLLQAVIDDPTPGPSVTKEEKLDIPAEGTLGAKLRAELQKSFGEEYDTEYGGWGFGHKYLHADSVEWAMVRSAAGDKLASARAKETLKKARVLVDPAWGGVYQYSAEGWNEPHFEKIMSVQADNLRLYSLAYARWKDPADLKVARAVKSYLEHFLKSPEGAFYVSQDADLVQGRHSGDYFKLGDKARRAKGIPRIDKHLYARENGWAADALAVYAAVTGDQEARDEAIRAVEWARENRSFAEGGFRHGEDDGGRLYLGDSLAMGQAMLRLYAITGDRKWLLPAGQTLEFIARNFAFTGDNGKAGGFVTAKTKGALPFRPERDENVALARFANLVYQYTGVPAHKEVAASALRYLGVPAIAKRAPSAGALLADWEAGRDPLHLTIVGGKKDEGAKALFQQALAYPASYKRVEWWDKAEGPLPRADAQYPSLSKASAFICTSSRCSLPIFSAAELPARIDRVLASADQ